MRVGILALQGGFYLHKKLLAGLGAETLEIRTIRDLDSIQGIVLPGGESTVLLRLLTNDLKQALRETISGGLPTFATCAGLILLARHVFGPQQESLRLLDIEVIRNAYGRQCDSFVDSKLNWTPQGISRLKKCGLIASGAAKLIEGIFIRAPRIKSVGKNVSVLVERNAEPVLVLEKNIIAATFHPELSDGTPLVHQLFLAGISAS